MKVYNIIIALIILVLFSVQVSAFYSSGGYFEFTKPDCLSETSKNMYGIWTNSTSMFFTYKNDTSTFNARQCTANGTTTIQTYNFSYPISSPPGQGSITVYGGKMLITTFSTLEVLYTNGTLISSYGLSSPREVLRKPNSDLAYISYSSYGLKVYNITNQTFINLNSTTCSDPTVGVVYELSASAIANMFFRNNTLYMCVSADGYCYATPSLPVACDGAGSNPNITLIRSNNITYLDPYTSSGYSQVENNNIYVTNRLSFGDGTFKRYRYYYDGFIENNQTYNITALGSSTENFVINITYDTGLTLTPYLVYNNVTYSGITNISSGGNIILNKSIIVPTQNNTYTFYWIFNLTNSLGVTETYYSSNKTQNVTTPTAITVGGSCGAGLTTAFNFTFYDEVNRSILNASSIRYNLVYGYTNNSAYSTYGTLNNLKSFQICINNSLPYYTVSYGEVQYSVTGYADRRFYIFSSTRVTNETVHNNLYSLSTTLASSFLFTLRDTNINPYVGYYTALLRWYPDLNEYRIVDMGKTDGTGSTVMYVKVEDVDYRVGLYTTSGTLVSLANPVRFVCSSAPCTYTFTVVPTSLSYTGILKVQSSLTFDTTTKIVTFTWNDPTQETDAMNLTVYRQISTGSGRSAVCSKTGSSFTGLLTCDISAYTSGSFEAVVTREASPFVYFANLFFNIETGLSQINPAVGFFISLVILVLGLFIGSSSPMLVVIFGIVALIPALILGAVNIAFIIGIAVMGGVIIHMIRRNA